MRSVQIGSILMVLGLGAFGCDAKSRAMGGAVETVAAEPTQPGLSDGYADRKAEGKGKDDRGAVASAAAQPPSPPPSLQGSGYRSAGDPSKPGSARTRTFEESEVSANAKRAAPASPTVQAGPTGAGSIAYGRPVDAPVAAAEQQPKLDPNARYATTYRPGGAALAAFDAAVQKGSIPSSYKTLVGDFGGRYAPQMDPPVTGALKVRVETERTVISPEGGKMNLRVALRSSDDTPGRAPLSVHLVLDVSGSMQGASIDNAKAAAKKLVERLEPTDDFSLTTFENNARVVVPDAPIANHKKDVLARIDAVQADGGTNISAGLDLGYEQAHNKGISQDAVRIVMLLSDGHANAGDTNPQSLAHRSENAFQDGIQTSSFGLGPDFDGALMSSIADRGAGGYYYLADSTQIAPALSRELDARLVPVATAVEVRVRLQPDVTPVKVYGSRMLDASDAAAVRRQEVAADSHTAARDHIQRDRKEDAEGGMRFFMPAFARADRHAMLITVDIPRGAGERSIASIEVKYKDRLQRKNITEEIRVKTRYGANEGESFASVNPSVAGTVQAFAAGDSIMQAAALIDRGARADAAHLLDERAQLMKDASGRLHDERLGEDARRLALLAAAANGKEQVNEPLALAVLLRGSGYGYMR